MFIILPNWFEDTSGEVTTRLCLAEPITFVACGVTCNVIKSFYLKEEHYSLIGWSFIFKIFLLLNI